MPDRPSARLWTIFARVDRWLIKSLSLSLSLSSWAWQGRAESEKGLSSPVPDQQGSFLCVCFVPHPVLYVIVHTSRPLSGFICDGPEASNGFYTQAPPPFFTVSRSLP